MGRSGSISGGWRIVTRNALGRRSARQNLLDVPDVVADRRLVDGRDRNVQACGQDPAAQGCVFRSLIDQQWHSHPALFPPKLTF